MLAIDARDVAKTFRAGVFRRRETVALAGVSLGVPRGAIFGLLGPNGAGKTTLLPIFSTLLLPDRGHVTVLGPAVARRADARARSGRVGAAARAHRDAPARPGHDHRPHHPLHARSGTAL